MYLKSLEIFGFKSFAKKTILEFEKGITAIVGPNGSGKSNVADCLRWVLGEQSAKLMRGKRSDDVIFAGSDKKTKLGFAEVMATFDNADRRIPIDTAEVSIGRRVDRSGESEYLINGNRVRLLDIVDLVLKSNIGTSRYTVIGQGTIDQMILAGPAEIKGLLDEASGVKTYYIKREKTLKRLEVTASNLMRAQDVVAEIEPRLKSLRRQYKRLEAKAQIESELNTHLTEWFSLKYWEQFDKLTAQQNLLAQVQRKKVQQDNKLKQLRNQADSLETKSTQDSSAFQLLKQDLTTLQGEKNKLLESLSLVRGKMQSLKTSHPADPATVQVELHTVQTQIANLRAQQVEAANNEHSLSEQIQQFTAKLKEVNVSLEQVYSRLSKPEEINWKLLDLEITALDQAAAELFRVSVSSDIGLIQNGVRNFQMHFNKFRTTSSSVLKDPHSQSAQIQAQLKGLLDQKEKLQATHNDVTVNLSKARMGKDFYEQQLNVLDSDRKRLELDLQNAQAGSNDEFVKSLLAEEAKVSESLQAIANQMSGVEKQLQGFITAEQMAKSKIAEAERAFRSEQEELFRVKDEETNISIDKAKIETTIENLLTEASSSLKPEVINTFKSQRTVASTQGLQDKINRLRQQLQSTGGMDDLTIREYQETETRFTTLTTQISDLQKGMSDLKIILDELDEHIKIKFNEAFHKINSQFEGYFRTLFNGGRAYLSLVKPEDKELAEELIEDSDQETKSALRPEEKIVKKYEKNLQIAGVDIKATPPGKKLSSIQALSGGERALTSIALLCSLLSCFPSPFVVLDEVDAALDDANTIRFGQILGTLANQTQFITITHNRETMAQSNILYGVTMGDDGVSRLLSVKLEQAKAFAK